MMSWQQHPKWKRKRTSARKQWDREFREMMSCGVFWEVVMLWWSEVSVSRGG